MNKEEVPLSFPNNILKFITLVWENSYSTDLTLVTDDGNHIEVHQAILSSCSDIFKNILIDSIDSHPFIYLHDIEYKFVKQR